MNQDQFNAVLKLLPVSAGADGWWQVPADQLLTVYASHTGTALNVTKVETLKLEGALLRLNTHRGEKYVLVLDDVFALASEAPAAVSRKAGFASE